MAHNFFAYRIFLVKSEREGKQKRRSYEETLWNKRTLSFWEQYILRELPPTDAPNSRYLLKGAMEALHYLGKADFTLGRTRHILYYMDESAGTYVFQFSREKHTRKLVEGTHQVKTETDVHTPYIFLAFDVQTQVLLIEHRSEFNHSHSDTRDKLEKMLDIVLSRFPVRAKINEISKASDFWEEARQLDHIREFEITLSAPNLFGGRFAANDLVREAKELYNITEMRVQLRNKDDKLQVNEEEVDSAVRMAAAGGGNFTLHGYKNGERRVVSSVKKILQAKVLSLTARNLARTIESIDKENGNG